jgi:hypothetical protein
MYAIGRRNFCDFKIKSKCCCPETFPLTRFHPYDKIFISTKKGGAFMFSLKNLLFPSLKFEIRSKKKPEEIASLLNEECTGEIWEDGRFHGSATPAGFKLTKLPSRGSRNSFTPVIIGEISQDGEETTVNIKMRMMRFVHIFCLLWCSPLPLFFLAGIFMSVTDGIGTGLPFLIIPVVFFASMQLCLHIGFWRPAKKTKEWLETRLS